MTNNGVKTSNENTTNGASGEPMGGMSGSYSALTRFADTSKYTFSWVSRGATGLSEDTWTGDGYTQALNRTNNRNVAAALFSDKYTKVGAQASSEAGTRNGDSQVNWITQGSGNDCSNAHAATFGPDNVLVTWEEISNPVCDYVAMGCAGQFAGTFYQQVTSDGKKVGEPLKTTDVYVAGDMVTMSDGRICWPCVHVDWDLSSPVNGFSSPSTTKKMSFACISLDNASDTTTATTPSSNPTTLHTMSRTMSARHTASS